MPKGNGNVRRGRKKRTLDLKIPIKAISTNKLYSGKKMRSWYYKKYRKEIFKFLQANYPDPVTLSGNLVLDMEVGFSSPLSDASNSIKGVEDCVSEFYNFNDRQIVRIVCEKYLVHKGDEYTHIRIRGTRKSYDKRRGKR